MKQIITFKKQLFLLCFAALAAMPFQSASGQSCGNCDSRKIGFYDPQVLVARPTGDQLTAESITQYWDLFRAGTIMASATRTNDPTSDCLTYASTAINNDGVLKFGHEWSNLPPDGPVKHLDYLVVPTISGAPGNYTLTVSVQAGESREVVAAGSITYATGTETFTKAAQLISQLLQPTYTTLRNWENNKRDSDPQVAVNANIIKLTPEKQRIKAGEEVKVDFLLTDCDGKPLANKTLILTGGEKDGRPYNGPTGGKFRDDQVITDDQGKASAFFKAGNAATTAELYAYFFYNTPTGQPDHATMGSATVNIDIDVEYWNVTVTARESYSYQGDTLTEFVYSPSMSSTNIYLSQGSGSAEVHFSGVVRNQAEDPKDFAFSTDTRISALTLKGSATTFSRSIKGESINGTIISGENRTDFGVYKPNNEVMSFQFEYTPESRSFSVVQNYHTNTANSYSHLYKDTWETSSYNYERSTWLSVSGSPEDGATIIKTDTGYEASTQYEEVSETPSANGTTKERRMYSASVSITPLPVSNNTPVPTTHTTAIALGPCTPNPVRTVAAIDYHIPPSTPPGAKVVMTISDISGRTVGTPVNAALPAGEHRLEIDANDLPNGLYTYTLMVNGQTLSGKMVIAK